MICQCSFLFFINPLRLRRFSESLNDGIMKHSKQSSQVNRRPPNSSAMWHKQVFTLQHNNKVCSVEASMVLLQNWGVGECGIQWLCVYELWLVGGSSVQHKNSSKHQQSSGRSIRSQNINLDRENNHSHKTTRESSNATVWLDKQQHGFLTEQQQAQRADATLPRVHCGILNRCPFPFFITITTRESSRAQACVKADGGITFHEKNCLHFI